MYSLGNSRLGLALALLLWTSVLGSERRQGPASPCGARLLDLPQNLVHEGEDWPTTVPKDYLIAE